MQHKNTLPAQVSALAETFDMSFAFCLYDGDECLCDDAYGYADRETGRKLTADDTFCLSLRSPWLLGTAILLLVEQKKLRLTQKLSDFYPDYAHADRITLKMLLRGRTGVPDYFLSVIRRGFDADPAYRALPERERHLREKLDKRNFLPAKEALALVAELPLEFEPDVSRSGHNRTEDALLAGIAETVTGKTLFALCKELIFDPAGATVFEGDVATTACRGALQDSTPYPLPRVPGFSVPDTFTVGCGSLKTLARVFVSRGLLTEKSWQLVDRYAQGEDDFIAFHDLDGLLAAFDMSVLGNCVCLLFDQKKRHYGYYVMSEMQTRRRIEGKTEYFRPQLRHLWESALQKMTEPKFVKLKEENIWDALALQVTQKQEDFVLDAPKSIAYCFIDKHRTPYLLTDGSRCIGLLVLNVNKKIDEYEIGIVIIDRRFQGRGYGRFMLEFAVDTLKKAGATRLSIGVNRENEVARHLYESLGFRAAQVYEDGVELVKEDV